MDWSAQTCENSVRSTNRDTNTRKTPELTCKDVDVCMQPCASNSGLLILVLASHSPQQIPYFIYVNFHASFAFGQSRYVSPFPLFSTCWHGWLNGIRFHQLNDTGRGSMNTSLDQNQKGRHLFLWTRVRLGVAALLFALWSCEDGKGLQWLLSTSYLFLH
jgi:hypothetical protein